MKALIEVEIADEKVGYKSKFKNWKEKLVKEINKLSSSTNKINVASDDENQQKWTIKYGEKQNLSVEY